MVSNTADLQLLKEKRQPLQSMQPKQKVRLLQKKVPLMAALKMAALKMASTVKSQLSQSSKRPPQRQLLETSSRSRRQHTS